MNFKEFTEAVKAGLEKLFEKDDVEIKINQITKNNGLVLTGVTMKERGEVFAPTIYLNDFYQETISEDDISDIILKVRQIYLNRDRDDAKKEDIAKYRDFNWVQDRVIYTLVNRQMNEERLKKMPYLPFQDLAITFRCVFHIGAAGVASAVISNNDMEQWNVDTKRLYQLASENTPRLLPPKAEKVTTFISDETGLTDFLSKNLPEEIGELHVMTNQIAVNGAAVMLYPNLLASCADQMQDDIYILPSSVHELIYVAAGKAADGNVLHNIVSDVNNKMMNRGDILSDQIYRYDRATKKVEMYHEN